MMAIAPFDFARLDGRSLQTKTGSEFKVVRVTVRSVTIRPERASRTYAL
jgi:hypothetical protein